MNVDTRAYTPFYEVHYWSGVGRILTIHNPGGASGPLLMELHVTGEPGTSELADCTMLTALALVEAGRPAGELVHHRRDGSMVTVALTNMATTPLREGWCERCRHASITDTACGLCDSCVDNAGRVVL